MTEKRYSQYRPSMFRTTIYADEKKVNKLLFAIPAICS
jgi:hypothetical protein